MKLNHRVVMERTTHISPGERYVVTGVVRGRGELAGAPLLVEASKRLYARSGILVARVAVVPKNFHVPVEVQNFTEETQTIFKGQTLGIAATIDDLRLYEQTPHATIEADMVRQRETVAETAEPTAPTFSANNEAAEMHALFAESCDTNPARLAAEMPHNNEKNMEEQEKH